MKTFYISTPIYYPSGKPHIGHAYSTILCDVIAKYKKLVGYEVFFSTGTDEHGKKIQEAAIKNNMELMTFIDQNVNVFINLWKQLGIEYTKFNRTTNIQHIRTVQKIFEKYNQNNLIYLNDWKSLYCVSCEENIAKKDVIYKDNECYCKIGHQLVETSESSYFFKMHEFQIWIKEVLLTKVNWLEPQARVNELINNFLDNELTDLSISRTSFDWGIPILSDSKHVIYVWMDALFNYLTTLDYLTDNDELYQKFWNHKDAEIVHVLSKEITRFHCIYWPIFLNCLNVNLPTKIISHGWIITETGKMSKSLNNVIDPFEVIELYGRDCLRYYLIKDMSLTNDNVFSNESMIGTYNGDLANNIGNLFTRTLGMIKKYFNNQIPKFQLLDSFKEQSLYLEKIKTTNVNIINHINALSPQSVLEEIQALINYFNKAIEELKPWVLFKENENDKLAQFMNILAHVVLLCMYWLQPVLIDGVEKMQVQFNINLNEFKDEQIIDWNNLDNHQVNDATPIFVRIENKQ